MLFLCDSGSGSRGSNGDFGSRLDGNGSNRNGGGGTSLGGLLGSGLVVGAVPRDVASLGALVADLAGGAEGTTVGSGAVTGDVAL